MSLHHWKIRFGSLACLHSRYAVATGRICLAGFRAPRAAVTSGLWALLLLEACASDEAPGR